jgi:hypothetical protein
VLECERAIAVEVFGQPDAATGSLEQGTQRRPTRLPVVETQVLAVDLKQVEGVKEGIARAQAADRGAQTVEIGNAIRR